MTARMSVIACPLWHRPTASTYEITHKDTYILAPLCPCSIISLSLPLVFFMHANCHAPTSSHLRHAVTLSSIMVFLLPILTRLLLAPPPPPPFICLLPASAFFFPPPLLPTPLPYALISPSSACPVFTPPRPQPSSYSSSAAISTKYSTRAGAVALASCPVRPAVRSALIYIPLFRRYHRHHFIAPILYYELGLTVMAVLPSPPSSHAPA